MRFRTILRKQRLRKYSNLKETINTNIKYNVNDNHKYFKEMTSTLYEENLKYQKAKILAKTVLEQRSVIENFFIDSLEKLKDKIYEKKSQDNTISGNNLKQKNST